MTDNERIDYEETWLEKMQRYHESIELENILFPIDEELKDTSIT